MVGNRFSFSVQEKWSEIDFQDGVYGGHLGFSVLALQKKKIREKSRECHNHELQSFRDTKRKRKQTKPNKRKWNKCTKSAKISSLFMSPRYFLSSFESVGLSVKRKYFKLNFYHGCHGDHLGLSIGRILAIFGLQVAVILPAKLRVSWPFLSGEEEQNRFSGWRPWQPSSISDLNHFSYIYKLPQYFLSSFESVGLSVQRSAK